MWIGLLSAALGAGAALLGAWYSAREQRRQWRDDLRLEAYVDLDCSARDVLFKGHDIGSDQHDGDKDRQIQALRDAIRSYRRAYARVRLVGPQPISEINESLHAYLSYCLYSWFENRDTMHEEDAPQVLFARELIETFDKEAERKLKVSKIPASGYERLNPLRAIRSRRLDQRRR